MVDTGQALTLIIVSSLAGFLLGYTVGYPKGVEIGRAYEKAGATISRRDERTGRTWINQRE